MLRRFISFFAISRLIFALLVREPLTFVNPRFGGGIARHAPIATGRERACEHLGPVGQARTLELLREETAIERGEPAGDGL